jgi:hypothetical protein
MTALLVAAVLTLVILTQVEIHHIYELVAGAQTSRPQTHSSSKLFHEYN